MKKYKPKHPKYVVSWLRCVAIAAIEEEERRRQEEDSVAEEQQRVAFKDHTRVSDDYPILKD